MFCIISIWQLLFEPQKLQCSICPFLKGLKLSGHPNPCWLLSCLGQNFEAKDFLRNIHLSLNSPWLAIGNWYFYAISEWCDSVRGNLQIAEKAMLQSGWQCRFWSSDGKIGNKTKSKKKRFIVWIYYETKRKRSSINLCSPAFMMIRTDASVSQNSNLFPKLWRLCVQESKNDFEIYI